MTGNQPESAATLPGLHTTLAEAVAVAEGQLTSHIRRFVDYEERWNERLKHAAAEREVADLQEEREAYETGLGIGALMERIAALQAARDLCVELVEMARSGDTQKGIARRVLGFFFPVEDGVSTSAAISADHFSSALLAWVGDPASTEEADIIITAAWETLEALSRLKCGLRTVR